MTEVTFQDIKTSLENLGIKSGDTVIVHSSMKSMGHVVGGPDAVIDAFLEVLGEKGTLVMPTLSQKNWATVYEDWHLDRPSDVGLLTEVFRKREGAYRSDQATHSVAAMGYKAQELTKEHTAYGPIVCPFGEYAFCKSSPWQKLYDMNAKIVFLGVTAEANTMKHLAECQFMQEALDTLRGTEHYEIMEKKTSHYGQKPNEGVWPYLYGMLLQAAYEIACMLVHGKCGDAQLLCIEAKPCVDYTKQLMREHGSLLMNEKTYSWYQEVLELSKMRINIKE